METEESWARKVGAWVAILAKPNGKLGGEIKARQVETLYRFIVTVEALAQRLGEQEEREARRNGGGGGGADGGGACQACGVRKADVVKKEIGEGWGSDGDGGGGQRGAGGGGGGGAGTAA